MQKIPENVMIVIKTVLPLMVIILLFVIVGQFGLGKITELRNQIATASGDQKILSQKLDILSSIASTGTSLSNAAVMALPSSNSALSVTSQVKVLASGLGLVLSEVKAGSPVNDPLGFSSVIVSFNVIGPRAQIETFLTKITSFAPITIVDKIKISESTPGTALGNISVKSFYAPFPTKLPAVGDAIADLTAAEKQTLKDVASLTQPLFSQIPASTGGGKADPFSP